MAEAASERLNRLQEADLGTARREEISTADRDCEAWLTRIEVIEASRRSNVPGTIEQRIAQANRDRLDAWSNVHKTIGDTGDLEHLDNLLEGQSHRLRLKKELRGGNTHDQQTLGRGQRALKGPTQNKPAIYNARLQNQAVPHRILVTSVSVPGGSPRAAQSNQHPSKHKPSLPQSRRALDPALDINNLANDTNSSTSQISGRSAHSAQTAPIPRVRARPRRPPLSSSSSSSSSRVYSQKISSPEEFLAEARSVTRGPEQESLIQKPRAKVSVSSPDRRGKNACLTPRSPNVVKPKEHKFRAQLARSMTPEDKVGSTGHDLGAGLMSTVSLKETPPTALINMIGQAKTREKLVPNPQEPDVTPIDSTPASRPKGAVGTLVDLDSAMESGNAAAMSPALRELEGLDFTQSLEPQTSLLPPLSSVKRKLDFGRFSHEKQQMSSGSDNPEATTDPEDEKLVEGHRREIDIICQLLQQTHLSDTFLSKLTECKEELEARLRQRGDPKLGTPQNQQFLTLPAPEPEKLEIAASVKASKAVAPELEELQVVRPVAINNTPTHGRNASTPGLSTPSSPSRLNARALRFTPISFLRHQTLSDATSDSISLQPIANEVVSASQSSESALSEDTVVPATADTPSTEPQPAFISTFKPVVREISGTGHSFGDHMLPGSRYRQPEQSHLYGVHSLPGRRVTPTAIYKQTVPETTEFALGSGCPKKLLTDIFTTLSAEAAASKPAPTIFSVYPPNKQGQTAPKPSPANFTTPLSSELIKIVDTNTLVNSKAKFSNGASAALGAPSSTNLKTAQKTTSMMESIYAPKLKVAPTSNMDVKKGLSASQ